MAHYAELDNNSIVKQVIVIANDKESTEQQGIAFCNSLYPNTRWIKTSYNGTIRKRFASIGYFYDRIRDAFIPPRPYASWIFDETTLDWKSPVPYPQDNEMYDWDELTQTWKISE